MYNPACILIAIKAIFLLAPLYVVKGKSRVIRQFQLFSLMISYDRKPNIFRYPGNKNFPVLCTPTESIEFFIFDGLSSRFESILDQFQFGQFFDNFNKNGNWNYYVRTKEILFSKFYFPSFFGVFNANIVFLVSVVWKTFIL